MATSVVRKQLREAVQQDRLLSRTGALQRLFAGRFESLVYPQIWEDPVVDIAALEISGNDNIVCISSGGCNVLSYVTEGPASIVALDLSPAHVALTKLKLTAARALPDHASFYALFGHADRPGNQRLVEDRLIPLLDDTAAAYWSSRRGLTSTRSAMFNRGFYRHGLLGRFIGATHILARLTGVRLQDFMACTTLEQQRMFFETVMEPALNRPIVRGLVNNRAALFGLGIPPQQYDALAGAANGNMHAVLKERIRLLMCAFPLSENYFAWQAFNRAYRADGLGPVPPYLQQDKYDAVRRGADLVEVLNRTFTDYLKDQPAQSKSVYVLLDAQDWMSDGQLQDIWAEITRTAAPGARVIFRTAGLDTILPGRVAATTLAHWHYEEDRSRALHRQDRSAIYGGFHLYRLKD